jgi:hypothetical protein
MLENLRFRVQAAAGVIEVDVVLVVETAVLAVAKRVDRAAWRRSRERREETSS